ncbi:MAG TPA: YncE family protein [Gallionella sp.]|nr:YncE family protein [Gallionella sp.]
MQKSLLITILLGACLSGAHPAHAATMSAHPMEFSIADRFHISGQGRWDLLSYDGKRHRLFISWATHVHVIDTDTGKVVGDIPGTAGVHGIALADDLNEGFTSNGKSNSVTVFDLATLKVTGNIKISGADPDIILYQPVTRHLYTFNGHSDNATVIDAVTHREIKTIALPGKPELAVSDKSGRIFVNIENKSEIDVIDSGSNRVIRHYPLGKGIGPTGLAIDEKHHRLFSVCANKIMDILDSRTGRIVAEIPIGAGPDAAAFDPVLGVAFSPNRDGTLTLVKEQDADHFSVMQNLTTLPGARSMAYDPANHRAYLVTASFGPTPPVTRDQPDPKPGVIPDSMVVLLVALAP